MTAIVRIPFHGAEIHTVLADAGPMVVLKPTVEAMGLDYSAQLKKLKTRSWATVAEATVVTSEPLASVRIQDPSVDTVHKLPEEAAVAEKTPVDHPLNCRCNKCRLDED